jgi:hypothetical protein
MSPDNFNIEAQIRQRIEEAQAILKEIGLPPAQHNERSALTLLAILSLKPNSPWSAASNPLMGITPIIEFMAQYYGKKYQPNTRETIRRQTVHQFLDAGIIVRNPDNLSRPVNSPKTVYQIENTTLKLIQSYQKNSWQDYLKVYLASVETLKKRYAQEQQMKRIPVRTASGETILLSPGGQNLLIQKIINEFCSRFTPGSELIYIGDAEEKWGYFDRDLLENLGVSIDIHGKMPDIVVYYSQVNWLVLIEAVTSHGPIDPKRYNELQVLFQGATVGLVFVTAFLTRKDLAKHLSEIAWKTEVWVAESPTHIVHFNGERFLGPY